MAGWQPVGDWRAVDPGGSRSIERRPQGEKPAGNTANFFNSSSHRIFRHMHKALNINKKTNYTI
jgi:hypothetical protein